MCRLHCKNNSTKTREERENGIGIEAHETIITMEVEILKIPTNQHLKRVKVETIVVDQKMY